VRIRTPLALGCAALLLVFGSRHVFWADYFVEAWPAYFAVNGTLVVGSAVAAAAEASAATARVTSVVRNFVMGMLLVGS